MFRLETCCKMKLSYAALPSKVSEQYLDNVLKLIRRDLNKVKL